MSMILCKLKCPDDIYFHWHGNHDEDDCLTLPIGYQGPDFVYIPVKDVKTMEILAERGLILEQEPMTEVEFAEWHSAIKAKEQALNTEPC